MPRYHRMATGNIRGRKLKNWCLARIRPSCIATIVKDFFDKGGNHAAPRDGKESGAYSHPTVPSVHPYNNSRILFGKARDVMTLAHELGHGAHHIFLAGGGADGGYAAHPGRNGFGISASS